MKRRMVTNEASGGGATLSPDRASEGAIDLAARATRPSATASKSASRIFGADPAKACIVAPMTAPAGDSALRTKPCSAFSSETSGRIRSRAVHSVTSSTNPSCAN
jgi:hypothetical protein